MSQENMKSRKEMKGLQYAGDPLCQSGREGIQRAITKQTGGPAWPTTRENTGNPDCSGTGMSLRDYFAAKALQMHMQSWDGVDLKDWNEEVCVMSYRMADAMLKARGEG